jgi:hypothetical protein
MASSTCIEVMHAHTGIPAAAAAVLDAMGVRYFADFGTLLGMYREVRRAAEVFCKQRASGIHQRQGAAGSMQPWLHALAALARCWACTGRRRGRQAAAAAVHTSSIVVAGLVIALRNRGKWQTAVAAGVSRQHAVVAACCRSFGTLLGMYTEVSSAAEF